MEALRIENIAGYLEHVVIPGLKELDKREEKKERSKGFHSRHVSSERQKQLPAFHPLYERSVHQYNEIQPHAEAEHFPKKLFEKLSPHQRGDEFQWLMNNYEPFSLPVFLDFLNTIKRGVNSNNYNISWSKTPSQYADESPESYFEKDLPKYKSIYGWFRDTYIDCKIKDANAVVAVMPLPSMWSFDEEAQEYVLNDEELFEPVPYIFSSKDVLYYEEDNICLVASQEKSSVKDGDKRVKKGWVLYIFNKETIWRIDQVGDMKDYEFEVFEYFNHDWGTMPAWKLKGLPRLVKDEVYYQSPFYFAVGNLNAYIKNKMTLEMAAVNSAYPYRIMVADECDYVHPGSNEKCLNGQVYDGNNLTVCPGCKGTGQKDKPSAGGTLLVKEADVEGTASLDRIRFVSPDTGILDWLGSKCAQEKESARQILHLRTTEDQASGSDDTATGRLIDHNSMYSFIRPIVEESFDNLDNVLAAITYMRYADSIEAPKVNRPTDMFEKTNSELLADYKDAVQSGMPPIVVKRFMEQYIKSLFYKTEQEKKIWKLALAADQYAPLPNEEIRNLKGANVVNNWQIILHYSIFSLIDQLIEEDENYLELEIEEQKDRLIAKAKLAATEAQATSARGQIANDIAQQ